MLAWCSHLSNQNLARSGAGAQAFEDLRVACGGVHKARFFERRGFATAGRDCLALTPEGQPVTHHARLPAAIVSYEALSRDSVASRAEREIYAQILAALRSQPAPSGCRADDPS